MRTCAEHRSGDGRSPAPWPAWPEPARCWASRTGPSPDSPATSASTRITVALLGRSHPSASLVAGAAVRRAPGWRSGDAGRQQRAHRPHPGGAGPDRPVHRRPTLIRAIWRVKTPEQAQKLHEGMVHVTAAAIEGTLARRRDRPQHRERRRAITIGIVYFALAVIALFVFGCPATATPVSAWPAARTASPTSRPGRARRRPSRYVVAVVFAGLGAAQFARRLRQVHQPDPGVGAGHLRVCLPGLGGGGSARSASSACSRRRCCAAVPITLGCARRGPVRARRRDQHRHRGHAAGRCLHRRAGRRRCAGSRGPDSSPLAPSAVCWPGCWRCWRSATRSTRSSSASSSTSSCWVSRRSSAVRVLADNPQLNIRGDLQALEDPHPGRHPVHRAGSVRPEPLRLPVLRPGGRRHLPAVLHPLGSAGAGGRRAPQAADTLGIDVFRVRYCQRRAGRHRSPASAAPTSRWDRWAASTRTSRPAAGSSPSPP